MRRERLEVRRLYRLGVALFPGLHYLGVGLETRLGWGMRKRD